MTSASLRSPKQTADPQEQWTTVRRKGRRPPKSHQHAAAPNTPTVTPGSGDRLSSLSISDIQRKHQRTMDQWKPSVCCHQLKEIITSQHHSPTVTRAICLGLGSFDPEDGSWKGKRRAHVQLAAFLTMVEQLQHGDQQPIRCIFQDPAFNSVDKDFIRGLGHEVVDSPEGFDLVDPSTLIFGVHLYKDTYSRAIAQHIPAVFVGTPREVWEECHDFDLLDWAMLKKLDERCDKVKFPQDEEDYTIFSTTSIHWRRQDET
ncbi:hypothetical protein M426DRAFT_16292 [Hypoxylon sp. CI-4A]|nr:hypothetical protein M426DRAFT_16292 [Hypoxylon sp. CI-4A]